MTNSTNFVPGTVVTKEWLNDVNGATYDGTAVYTPAGVGAVATTTQAKLREMKSVQDSGALLAGADESAQAAAMLADHGYLYVPRGRTLIAKNLTLTANQKVYVDGTLKLPSGCVDFDRLLIATTQSGVEIYINELDGNAAGQSGNIGTHLVYMTNCTKPIVKIKYLHDHYIASGAATPSVDGIRNASTGPVFLYQADKADVDVGMISGWGREAVYLLNCTNSESSLGHAQGTGLTEYSGIQVSGRGNKILRASVDNAGASGVGFDTSYGTISNILSTNTRENHGVNFGHTGYPATGSVGTNIVVDGAYVHGISVGAATTDLTLSNFSVTNVGLYGVNFSDSSVRGKISNGVVSNSGSANLNASVTVVESSNVRSEEFDQKSITVTVTSGLFIAGEVITSSGGATGTVRKALKNLTSAQQILFLNSVTGTFVAAQTLSGGTSSATGTISIVSTPAQYNEALGGSYVEQARYYPGSAGNQTRFADGTAILQLVLPVAGVAATLGTFTSNYASNVLWAAAPVVTATIASASSTDAFVLNMMRCASTTATITLTLKTDTTQTYGVQIVAVGRWK